MNSSERLRKRRFSRLASRAGRRRPRDEPRRASERRSPQHLVHRALAARTPSGLRMACCLNISHPLSGTRVRHRVVLALPPRQRNANTANQVPPVSTMTDTPDRRRLLELKAEILVGHGTNVRAMRRRSRSTRSDAGAPPIIPRWAQRLPFLKEGPQPI